MPHTDHGGVSIGWEMAGRRAGPPVVLVHSLGCDRSMWAPQVAALGVEHLLLLVDVRGHGTSDAPPGPYSVPELAGDVLAVADDAGVERFHLGGISIGGLVALWLAVHHGDRLASLIACNTAAKIGTAEGWNDRIAAIRAGGMESVRAAIVDRWFSPGFADVDPETFARVNEVFAATPPQGYIGCCAALASADLREVVDGITVPTLLVGGERDVSTPPAETEWLHDRIAASRSVLLQGAGHLSNLDRPSAYNAAVGAFLAER